MGLKRDAEECDKRASKRVTNVCLFAKSVSGIVDYNLGPTSFGEATLAISRFSYGGFLLVFL